MIPEGTEGRYCNPDFTLNERGKEGIKHLRD
jgi:hypothetical protein